MSVRLSANGGTSYAGESASSSTTRPVYWWATVGALCLLFQFYVLGAWIMSDKFVPSDPGPDQMNGFGVIMEWFICGAWVVMGIGGLAWILRTLLRGERLKVPQVMMLALWTCNWQDPLINAWRPTFLYNMHYWNRGSWSELVPGWLSPNGSKMPEPLLWNVGCYITMVGVGAFVAQWAMRKVQRRWPGLSAMQLIGVGFLAFAVMDTLQEFAMVQGEVFAYGGVIRRFALFAGTRYQFPVFEGFLWSIGTTACAALMFFRDRNGRMLVERGIDDLRLSTGKENVLRVLAVAGFANPALFLYIVIQLFASLYIDAVPADLPSYFINGICGAGTHYPCPAPDVPIQTIHSLGMR